MITDRAWDTALPPLAPAGSPLARILIVDDEPGIRLMLAAALKREGYEVQLATDGRSALAVLEGGPVDVVVTDIRMPQMTGIELLDAAKRIDPGLSVIMMTAYGSKDTVLDALRLGATDYVEKGDKLKDELTLRIRKELARKRLLQENVLMKRTLKSSHQFSSIIGASDPMLAVFQLIETIAPTNSTVLIAGESGTGKELVARAIHFNSPRKDRPFVALNCGALSETLLDSELFGHVRGAFTGADTNKKGLIEVAEKGTIFLDEISEMSPLVQVKVLRVLQERRFRRLGGTDEVEADIRILAATNRDLSKLVAEGRFREDLFYRINVIPVRLPPLRERRDDIPAIAHHFAGRFALQMGKPISGISGQAMAYLQAYGWPGNVRELENAMERAVALEQTATILPESLPDALLVPHQAVPAVPDAALLLPNGTFDLEAHVARVEKEYLVEALKQAHGVKTKAAERLGLTFRQFRYLLKKYDVKDE
ncbi:MAG TPA: sigma-54 dependent transcriptional regulator [Vicinamibacterales bacterium]|nr:sigma-54 dependent transcriptional regulator [Vicinamibacterales bacterium]